MKRLLSVVLLILLASLANASSIHRGAISGDVESVSRSIEGGEKIDAFNEYGMTPLQLACFYGKTEVVRFLVAKGADVNLPTSGTISKRPIHVAAQVGNLEIMKVLASHGADLTARDSHGDGATVLNIAADRGYVELVIWLIDSQHLDVDIRGASLETPLMDAAAKGQLLVMRALLVRGAKVNTGDGFLKMPLHWAAEKGQLEAVKMLLVFGAYKQYVEGLKGKTAAQLAQENGHRDVAQLLK